MSKNITEELGVKENIEGELGVEESLELNKEVLQSEAKKTIEKVVEESKDDTLLDKIYSFLNKDISGLSTDSIKKEVKNLENNAEVLTETTIKKIEQEIKEPSIDHLLNYKADSMEAKLTKIILAPKRVQERFNETRPNMKEAMALVCGEVFNNCEYPYALIGSNCYIPHTEYSAKIPDDLDVIFGINDKDTVYKKLLDLEKAGLVENLMISDVICTDKSKGDVKIHCFIKGGPEDKDWVEMEAFGQNMATQVEKGEKCKSYVPLGVEEKELEVIEVKTIEGKTVKVNIGSEKVAKELYFTNIIKEFNLYNLNGWENRAMLNSKALQRIFNIINLDSQNTEESIDNLMEEIAKIKPQTETIQKVRDSLVDLWSKFNSLPVNKEGGLVDYLIKENKDKIKKIDADEEKEPEKYKILSTEAAVDIITKETNKDLRDTSVRYNLLKAKHENILNDENASAQEIEQIINDINQERGSLIEVSLKYKNYLDKVNSGNKNDFCVYAAMPQLRFHFLLPMSLELAKNKMQLKAKLEKMENK